MLTMNQKVSDEDFLALWAKHQTAVGVSKQTGLSLRNVYKRRRAVESRLGTRLSSAGIQGPEGHKRAAVTFESYRGRIIHEMQNGVAMVFSDAHFWPDERTTAFRGFLKLCRELKPQVVVCNGDAFDGAAISRFQRIGWDQRPTVRQELEACDERLTEIEDAAKGAKFYWPLGNHDARFEIRIANTVPEYEGVPGFTLKERFPRWLPCWSVWVNNHTVIKHRWKGGIHATYNNAMQSGKHMVTGHLHSLKVYPITDYNGDRFGVDTGTLSDIYGQKFEGYLEDGVRNWRSGFAVLTFRNGELLWPEVVRKLDDDHIDFRGRAIQV